MNPKILLLRKRSCGQAEKGFTLLEILVALAVVAIGIAAVVNATSASVDRAAALEAKVLSTWVASNRLAEMRLTRTWRAPGETQGSAALGGRDWYYREQVTATPDPDILRVDIWVYGDESREVETGYLFGYLGKP